MKSELEIIRELMEELENKMQYSADDFKERLGRKDPEEIAILKVEKKASEDMPEEESEDETEESIMARHMAEEEISPEEKLKQRLMKLRG